MVRLGRRIDKSIFLNFYMFLIFCSSFSEIAVKFITQHGFDGLDIDWEFPSWPTPNPAQKRNFTLLIKELRSSINSFNPNLTMSIAVGAPASIFLQCYEIADMAKYVYLHYLNCMNC